MVDFILRLVKSFTAAFQPHFNQARKFLTYVVLFLQIQGLQFQTERTLPTPVSLRGIN